MANNIQESINNAIDIIVERRIDALVADKTIIGIIDSVVDSIQGIYKIKYDGGYFKAESQSGAIFPKGMSVYIQIPQNDMTKRKFIIGRASDLRESERADVVISNLNNYAIIGNSIVSPKNESTGEGIRSYHNEINENDTTHPITHRAKLIYSNDKNLNTHYNLDLDALQLYKENATALMVQAEFRTSFDITQRYSGTGLYGIGLNLSFENSDYQYGSTQGEMFDYFSGQIEAEIERYNDETQEEIKTKISMQQIDNEIQLALINKTFDDLTKEDGILDKYIAYSNSLITAYAAAMPELYLQEEDSIMQAYLAMLSDLRNLTTSLIEVQTMYQEWRDVITGKSSKEVSYVLDSNNMTGDPFAFSSWSTQYAIFNIDFEHFQSIDSILFYKQGFNWSVEKEEERREDIFIRNLKIYTLQPISAINGDYRLEMQTPDGLIFETLDKEEKLTITGKVTKAYYEDLSNNATYYWFKKNPVVTSVTHSLYNQYGGIGWEYIGGPEKKGSSKTILVYGNENTSYKNNYKCVCLVDETILLKEEFTLYNNAAGTDLEINSDLGQVFSFDAGAPVLTCLLKLKGQNTYEEYLDDKYQYIWNITINNITTSFEYNYLHQLESIEWDENLGSYIKKSQSIIPSIAEAMRGPSEGNIINIIQNVQFFKGDELIILEKDIPQATRIKYPISNLVNESVVTFTCSVIELKEDTTINLGEATIDLQNQGHPQISSYRLILENGDQVFQYDEYGNPPNSPKLKSPQEIKPIIPHLLNPAGIEVSNKNYKVQWTLPIENTLIISSTTLGLNPFDNGKISLDSNPQCVFSIAESYNEDKLNNQILCRITLNDEVIQATTDFYFGKVGSNGTNGTDMVAKIVPTQNKQILNTQPVILYRYNNGNNVIFNTGIINGPEVFLASSDSSKVQIFKAKLYQKNEEISEDSFTVRWNIAGNPQATANKISRYIDISSHLNDDSKWISSLQWNESFNQPTDDISRIKYQPIYTIRAQITYQDKDYYAFYSFPVIYYNSTTIPTYNRIAINKSTLLKEIVYNADGRNPIYNHNQGVEIINIPKDATVSWYAYGGENGDEFTADFKLLKERNGKKKDATTQIIPDSLEDSQNFIYILPNDDYNGSHTNNRIIAVISKDNEEIAIVTVPLYMHLNTFGLASLNAWDGNTVTIDEDSGYVMAPQVGAGEKDLNNRFTGILMGKTETYTGSSTNEVETGLFGYAHGIQSIFLDSNTGEAYFGLPDGKILDKTGNIPIPKDGDNYNEGRVELIPGGVSKIGGWRLGHQSLYYTSSGNIGNKYGTPEQVGETARKEYIPQKDGSVEEDKKDIKTYSGHHTKDIKENDSGILIHAGGDPYISIKGRALDPQGVDKGLLDTGTESFLRPGDSLEIQLDPKTPTLFSIFRHNGEERYKKRKNDEGEERLELLYEKNSRTFLAGINGRGQLVANGLQSMTQNTNQGSSTDTITTFGIDAVAAFGETIESATHIGLKMLAGADIVGKLFIKDKSDADTPLYLSGSGDPKNEYKRPISIHGKSINLYSSNSDNTATTTDSKIILDDTKLEAGNFNTSYLSLYTNSDSTNALHTVGSLNIETTAGTSEYGHINIYAGSDNTRSYLTLNNSGEANLLGRTNLNEYAQNGNINLYARTNGTNSSWLTLIQNGDASLRAKSAVNITAAGGAINETANTEYIVKAGTNIGIFGSNTDASDSSCGLYLPVASEENKNVDAFLKSVRPLTVSGTFGLTLDSGGAIGIKTTGTEAKNIITIENVRYNPSKNGSHIIDVSTAVGGFSIQKNVRANSNRKGDSVLVLSNDPDENKVTGFVAPYGYFSSDYDGDNSIYANKNIYAKEDMSADEYVVRNDGAYSYTFDANQTITVGTSSNSFTVRGGSIGALLEALMVYVNNSVIDLAADIDGLQESVNNLNKNKANRSDLQKLRDDFDNHTHMIGYYTSKTTDSGGDPSHTHYYNHFEAWSNTGAGYESGKPRK